MSKLIRGVNDFQTKFPDAVQYWHPTLNKPLNPSDVAYGSKIEIKWICEKGHVWPSKVNAYTTNLRRNPNSSGCPYCDNKKVLAGYNDLASKYPDVAKEWDWERNKESGKSPSTITAYTNDKYFWRGSCGHSWEARVADRTLRNAGCKECARNSLHPGVNDLQTLAPGLSVFWNEEKNHLNASNVAANSHNKEYWWKCELGHEWQDSPNHRYQHYCKTHFANCPTCSKALHTSFPEKAVFYYASKVFKSAHENYSFQGKLELDVYIEEESIAIEYDGSAFHKQKKVKSDSLKNKLCHDKGIKLFRLREKSCANLADDGQTTVELSDDPNSTELDCGLNNLFLEIGKYLHREIDVDIDIERDVADIYALQKLYLRRNSLYETHPELLKEWDYNHNGKMGIFPKGITAGSNIDVYWKCEYSHPVWKAKPNTRVYSHSKCPYCSGKKVIPGVNDLATVFPDLMEEWDYDANSAQSINPHEILPQSGKQAYWICKKNPGHRWSAKITNRTTKGADCPICSNNLLLIGDNDFKTRYPEVAKEWDYVKNKRKPEEYFPSSTDRVWWIGSKCGHSWDMRIVDRTGKKPQGCPICAGRRVLIGYNDFPSKNPDAFKDWDYIKNKDRPEEKTCGSNYLASWKCRVCGHEWKDTIYSRCLGKGCPECARKKT